MFGFKKKCTIAVEEKNAGQVITALVEENLGASISIDYRDDNDTAYVYEFYARKDQYWTIVDKLKEAGVEIPYWDNFGEITWRRP